MPDFPRDDVLAHGAYVANLAHCMQCHTPLGADGRRDYRGRLGAGGLAIDGVWGSRQSANITADRDTGIGGWSDADIKRAMTHGTRPDGGLLSSAMPWSYWSALHEDDLDALVAWLRTLKPVSNHVVR